MRRDLIAISASGSTKDAFMKSSDSLAVAAYTGVDFSPADREKTTFVFTLVTSGAGLLVTTDGTSGSGVSIAEDASSHVWTMTTKGVKEGSVFEVHVFAYWNGSSLAIEGHPLNVTVNTKGSVY